MEVKEILKFIENKEKELSTYKETDKEIVRNLCSDKNKKIIEFNEIYAIENVLNRLEQLEKENKEYTVRLTDEQYRKVIEIAQKDIIKDTVPKSVIRDKFKRINETKIKTDKINARNYMIFGDTDRATGWFINIDYIEKILLDIPGYKIEEE